MTGTKPSSCFSPRAQTRVKTDGGPDTLHMFNEEFMKYNQNAVSADPEMLSFSCVSSHSHNSHVFFMSVVSEDGFSSCK